MASRPDDTLQVLHLCSGYGGFEIALRLAGIKARTVGHVERETYAASVLMARMEEARLDHAPIFSDIETFDGTAWRGKVDFITAGFPCQPFSIAGSKLGTKDGRWLWPAIATIIGDVGPRYVFLENVPQLVNKGLAHVLSDLASFGFDAEWGLLSAESVGAPHKRQRFWLFAWKAMADADCTRCEGSTEIPTELSNASLSSLFPPGRDDYSSWEQWLTEGGPQPGIRRGPDGRPPWLADALHCGGNGLVPQVAATALCQLTERAGVHLPRVKPASSCCS